MNFMNFTSLHLISRTSVKHNFINFHFTSLVKSEVNLSFHFISPEGADLTFHFISFHELF
jgi:hypothetical protein